MKLLEGNLGSLAAVAATPPQNIEALESVYVHVSGTFTATIVVEVSFDQGATWAVFQTFTTAGLSSVLPPSGRVRCRASAYTNGAAVCNFGGRNQNLRA